ncbi:hypothetical protein D3C72_2233480 [compost metagenome]
MVKIRMVEGFSEIPKYPIMPAVIIKGTMLGSKEINIMPRLLNWASLNSEISTMARAILSTRCSSM